MKHHPHPTSELKHSLKGFFMPEGPTSQEHMTPGKQMQKEKQQPFAVI